MIRVQIHVSICQALYKAFTRTNHELFSIQTKQGSLRIKVLVYTASSRTLENVKYFKINEE